MKNTLLFVIYFLLLSFCYSLQELEILQNEKNKNAFEALLKCVDRPQENISRYNHFSDWRKLLKLARHSSCINSETSKQFPKDAAYEIYENLADSMFLVTKKQNLQNQNSDLINLIEYPQHQIWENPAPIQSQEINVVKRFIEQKISSSVVISSSKKQIETTSLKTIEGNQLIPFSSIQTNKGELIICLKSQVTKSYSKLKFIVTVTPESDPTKNITFELSTQNENQLQNTFQLSIRSKHSKTIEQYKQEKVKNKRGIEEMKCQTYNIWNFNDDWLGERLGLISNIIKENGANIIGIQEVRENISDPDSNQLLALANALQGYQHIYTRAVTFLAQGYEEGIGMLIADDIDIELHEYWNLTRVPGCGDLNTRVLTRAKLETKNGEELNFYNTHWSYDQTCQISNALESWSHLKETQNRVYTGDFNTLVTFQKPINFLLGKIELDGKRGDFTDSWLKTHPGLPGYTFRTWDPNNRIDRVLYEGSRIIPLNNTVVGKATTPPWPSDHMSVVFKFNLVG